MRTGRWRELARKVVWHPRWEQVLRLLAGMLPPGEAEELIRLLWRPEPRFRLLRWLQRREDRDDLIRTRLWMACKCAAEARGLPEWFVDHLGKAALRAWREGFFWGESRDLFETWEVRWRVRITKILHWWFLMARRINPYHRRWWPITDVVGGSAAAWLMSQPAVREALLGGLMDVGRVPLADALDDVAGEPTVREALLHAQRDTAWTVRAAAMESLAGVAGQPAVRVEPLRALRDDEGTAGVTAVIEALLGAVAHPSPWERRAVAEALAMAVCEDGREVRRVARALRRWGATTEHRRFLLTNRRDRRDPVTVDRYFRLLPIPPDPPILDAAP